MWTSEKSMVQEIEYIMRLWMEEAKYVFDKLHRQDLVACNVSIAGYGIH